MRKEGVRGEKKRGGEGKKNKKRRWKKDMNARTVSEAPFVLGSTEMIVLTRCTYDCSR